VLLLHAQCAAKQLKGPSDKGIGHYLGVFSK
jgi:hypothetical protein